jgi:zinc D-Ala-D-Ala dipeptidase
VRLIVILLVLGSAGVRADAGPAARADWVDVAAAVPDAVLDLRYASERNVTGAPIYPVARCLLRRGVATRLVRAARTLRHAHRRLVLWDCYRPASAQRILWRNLPDPARVARPRFAADGTPTSGSDHSRGAAVDVSLAGDDGAPLAMPTDHDDHGPAAGRARARAASAEVRRLDDAMRAAGFRPLATEWWHFAAPDAGDYALGDRPLADPPVR